MTQLIGMHLCLQSCASVHLYRPEAAPSKAHPAAASCPLAGATTLLKPASMNQLGRMPFYWTPMQLPCARSSTRAALVFPAEPRGSKPLVLNEPCA
eukprot:1156819-Pelagomonas_calceolata.AAC.3